MGILESLVLELEPVFMTNILVDIFLYTNLNAALPRSSVQ